MPPQRRARRNQGPQGPQCQQAACIALRSRLGGLCAARACVQRDFEHLQAQVAIMQARAGGNGALPAGARRVEAGGDSATQRENIHILKARIRAVMKTIEEISASGSAANDPVIKAIEERVATIEHELNTGEGDLDPAVVEEYHTLQAEASKMRVEKQPMTCGICLDPIGATTHIMGKNCVHTYCIGCIASVAFSQVKPSHQVDDHPYWQHAGHQQDLGPNGMGVAHNYAIRPEHLDDEGVPKVFPTNTWVSCPECRNPHYADAAYHDMYKKAHATINDDSDLVAPKQPVEVITEMQAEEVLLIVDAPKAEGNEGPDLVLAVEAKIPGTPDHGDFPRGPTLGTVLRLAGFELDKKVKTTGSGWVREKSLVESDGFTIHPIDFRGGTLTMTAPQRKRTLVQIADGADGAERFERQLVEQGGGFFKFSYPAPPPAVGNNAEAGPSDPGLHDGLVIPDLGGNDGEIAAMSDDDA